MVAWHILPVSDTPFFPRGLWVESSRVTSGVSCWMAGGVDLGPVEKVTWVLACGTHIHADAYKSTKLQLTDACN